MKYIIVAMMLSFNVSASPVLDQVQQDILASFPSNHSNGNNGNGNGNGNNGHHHGGGNSGNGNGGNTGTTPTPSVNTVPEPDMIALFGIALLGMAFTIRKGKS